jgi:hypothetical protein
LVHGPWPPVAIPLPLLAQHPVMAEIQHAPLHRLRSFFLTDLLKCYEISNFPTQIAAVI